MNLCALGNSNVSHKSHSSWTGPEQTFAQSLQITFISFRCNTPTTTYSNGEKRKYYIWEKNYIYSKNYDGNKHSFTSMDKKKTFPRIKIVKLRVRIKEYVWKSLSERNGTEKGNRITNYDGKKKKKTKKQATKKITRKNHNIERGALRKRERTHTQRHRQAQELRTKKTWIKLLLIEFDITSS